MPNKTRVRYTYLTPNEVITPVFIAMLPVDKERIETTGVDPIRCFVPLEVEQML